MRHYTIIVDDEMYYEEEADIRDFEAKLRHLMKSQYHVDDFNISIVHESIYSV